MKVLHKNETVLDDFLDELRRRFEQRDELTENIELIHEYLGITIDYSIAGKVVFTMFNCLEDMIVECVEDLKYSCFYYPGNNQLFRVAFECT